MMSDLKTELFQNGEVWTLKLIGHVNAGTAHSMWNVDNNLFLLKKMTESGANTLVIDLGQTKTVDSHGLRLLIDAQKKFSANNVQIILKSPNPHLSRLFRVMQFDRLFAVEP